MDIIAIMNHIFQKFTYVRQSNLDYLHAMIQSALYVIVKCMSAPRSMQPVKFDYVLPAKTASSSLRQC